MSKNWIKDAIKKPGSLRAEAKRKNAIAPDGDIKKSFLDKAASGAYGKKTEKRANLAKTLSKMDKPKKESKSKATHSKAKSAPKAKQAKKVKTIA